MRNCILYTDFVPRLIEVHDLKKYSLFFDKIYVPEYEVIQLRKYVGPKSMFSQGYIDSITPILSEMEYLIEIGIVATFEALLPSYVFDDKPEVCDELKIVIEAFQKKWDVNLRADELNLRTHDKSRDEFYEYYNDYMDLYIRLACVAYSAKIPNLFPILKTQRSFELTNKNSAVLCFTLEKIPVPSDNTPWEQIIDFRKDEDSQNKYYALIHWANQVASSNKPLHEVEDEYNYLYSEYCKAFDIHKMKSSFTAWEILMTGAIDSFMSLQGFSSVIRNLFSISKTRIQVKEEEMKLPGREIAYIHKANETFR